MKSVGIDHERLSPEQIRNLLYEFEVYQVELEMQNEELRTTQQRLEQSAERYAQLYDYAPIGYLTLNTESEIVQSNLKAAEILGCKKFELIGKKLVQFIHRQDQDHFYFYNRELWNVSDRNVSEFRLKNEAGPAVFIELQSTLHLSDDENPRILMAIHDISDRIQAETTIRSLNEQLQNKIGLQTDELLHVNQQLQQKLQELASSKRELLNREAKLNSIFNAAVEGIVTIDEQGVIESVNASLTEIFGYEKEELIGRNIKKLMPQKIADRHDDYLAHYLKHNQRHIVGSVRELQGRHKNGTLVPIDLSVAEFEIEGLRYYTGLIRDVSERKLKEQRDKEHLAELAHVTRLGLMGEMASGIAHEVNQPLTSVVNYTQVCLNLLSSASIDRAKLTETLQKTHQQALKAGQIIHRMRDFVKSHKIQRTSVNINDLVRTAMALCEAECKRRQIIHKTELMASLPTVNVDYIQIEQVLLNLLRNSVEALLTLPESANKQLVVQTYLNEDQQVEVRVKDNGPGLDDAQQREVFKPFYTTKETGMGMGLAICRSIVEAHNGLLRFNSKPGKGTTFYFTLSIA